MSKISINYKLFLSLFIFAVVFIAAVFLVSDYYYLFIGLLLFLPLLDKNWTLPRLNLKPRLMLLWLLCVCILSILLFLHPEQLQFVFMTILLVALPEEWFFRAYLMTRLGKNIQGNIVSSIAFSLIHGVTRGWAVGVEVFIPSLLFGWLFQKTDDLISCVLVHSISNLLFILFINEYMGTIRSLFSYVR